MCAETQLLVSLADRPFGDGGRRVSRWNLTRDIGSGSMSKTGTGVRSTTGLECDGGLGTCVSVNVTRAWNWSWG